MSHYGADSSQSPDVATDAISGQSEWGRNEGRDSDRARVRRAYSRIRASCTLPSPDEAVLDILRVANDPYATVDAISTAVEIDPATAGRLLKYANSPRAGVTHKVSSVRAAVTLLGTTTVKSIALGFSLVHQETRKCCGFDDGSFWPESLARAVASRGAAIARRFRAPDEFFTCGLLSQIGRLALATVFPATYAEVLAPLNSKDPAAQLDSEREAFDLDHAELSAEMMGEWGLPSAFCEAVRSQYEPGRAGDANSEPNDLARLLRFSHPVAALVSQRDVSRGTLTDLLCAANAIGIMPDLLTDVFDTIWADWVTMSRVFSLRSRRALSLGEMYMHAH